MSDPIENAISAEHSRQGAAWDDAMRSKDIEEIARATKRLQSFCEDASGDDDRLNPHGRKAATVGDLRVVLAALNNESKPVSRTGSENPHGN